MMTRRSPNGKKPWMKYPEYESKIAERRIDKGLTLKGVAEKSGCSTGHVFELQMGYTSPTQKNGQIKETAKKIACALDEDVYDLFPMYFCSAEKMKEKQEAEIKEAEQFGESVSEFTITASEKVEEIQDQRELSIIIRKILATLKPREEKILRERFGIDCEEKTLEEIGKDQNCSGVNIRIIECRALRKLRHPNRSNKVKAFYSDKKEAVTETKEENLYTTLDVPIEPEPEQKNNKNIIFPCITQEDWEKYRESSQDMQRVARKARNEKIQSIMLFAKYRAETTKNWQMDAGLNDLQSELYKKNDSELEALSQEDVEKMALAWKSRRINPDVPVFEPKEQFLYSSWRPN